MEHIRVIQETLEENKEVMPTGMVVTLMNQCQLAYEAMPKLWKISYVQVDAEAKNRASALPKTVIMEEGTEDKFSPHQMHLNVETVFNICKMPPESLHEELWLGRHGDGPYFFDSEGRVIVVTKVERWGRKRARTD